jgi:molybdopterin synthase catalytic subunit
VAEAARLVLRLHASRFDPLEALGEWHRSLNGDGDVCGGTFPAAEAHFIGRVRGVNGAGVPLDALELEHYPGMSEAQIQRLAAAITERHGLLAVRVDHRVGLMLPGEAIVLVAVAADRRGPAQRGGQELLEALKHEAPFWKREWSGGEGTWVEGNTEF